MPSITAPRMRRAVEPLAFLAGASAFMLATRVLELADVYELWVLFALYPVVFVGGVLLYRRRAATSPTATRRTAAVAVVGLLLVLQAFNPTRAIGILGVPQPKPGPLWLLQRAELSLDLSGHSLGLVDGFPVVAVAVPWESAIIDFAYLAPGLLLTWLGFFRAAVPGGSAESVE